MLQVSVNRRHLLVFTAVVALIVSVAWVGAASRVSAGSSTPVVYVATGENFPDALGAGPAAATVNGPILLVAQNAIPGETAAELTRLAPDKIIIVGGTAVVSVSVENGLKAYAGTVERVAGSNRYDTAAKLSAATFPVTPTGPVSGDADTLDGKDSTAFSLTGHNHDSNYLAKTGKATDSDTLDGKDSTAFVEHGDIVTVASGANWVAHPSSPFSHFAPVSGKIYFEGVGWATLGLDAPVLAGGVTYELSEVEICHGLRPAVDIDETRVFFEAPPHSTGTVSDLADHSGDGCYTVDVSAGVPPGASGAAGVELRLKDNGSGGPIDGVLWGVRATWSPAP